MAKTNVMMTDEKWQRECRKRLLNEVENHDSAARVVAYLDANPELKKELSGVYYKALDTIKPTRVKSKVFINQLTEEESLTLKKMKASIKFMGDDAASIVKELGNRIRPEYRRTAMALAQA